MNDNRIATSAHVPTVEESQELMKLCLSADTSTSTVFESLAKFSIMLEEYLRLEKAQKKQAYLDIAKNLTSVLRKEAIKHDALKYYYFGFFQAHVDRMQEDLTQERSEDLQWVVASQKNSLAILKVLYDEEVIQHSLLAQKLHMEKGNLSKKMKQLIMAGFVEQRNAGKYSFYNLSAHGYTFYQNHIADHAAKRPASLRKRSNMNQDVICYAFESDILSLDQLFIPQQADSETFMSCIHFLDAHFDNRNYLQEISSENITVEVCDYV